MARDTTPARWREAGAFLCHRGHEIFYRREASGAESLLVVHGFPTASVVLTDGGLFYDRIQLSRPQRLLRSPLGRVAQHLMGRSRFKRSFRSIFDPRTQPSEAELEALWSLIVADRGRGVLHAISQYLWERKRHQDRWSEALARAPAPLQLVYGPEDPISRRPIAERFAQIVPDADIVALEGVGHYPQLEAPERMLAAFDAFHERLGTPR